MGTWHNEDFDRSYETSPSLPSSDDDSDGHDRSEGNARKRKRVKTEHSQQLGGSSSGGLTAAEAARARWGNPGGAAPAATTSKPPSASTANRPHGKYLYIQWSLAEKDIHSSRQHDRETRELSGLGLRGPALMPRGFQGRGPNSFDLLGVFGSFEDANVKTMEYVWRHHSDHMEEGRCLNLTPEKPLDMDYGVMYWYIDSSHGTLTLESVD